MELPSSMHPSDERQKRLLHVTCGKMSFVCELNETRTAKALFQLASEDPPIRETAKIVGQEVYCLIPLRAWYRFVPDFWRRIHVKLGDVGYWPHGGYLCFFFGPRPGDSLLDIKAHAPVVVVGSITEGLDRIQHFEEYSMIEIKGSRVP
jgi:hypothetical protein